MEFRDLQAFVEVARTRNFSRAAERLNATQSAISKAVRRLEVSLGMPLFDRSGTSLRLTDAGDIVQQRGQKLLNDRDSLVTEVNEIAGLTRGVLRLGLPAIGSNILFASAFTVYRKKYPGIDIRLVEDGSSRLEQLLMAGDIDLAASLMPFPEEEFDWLPVRNEPVVALLPVAHPLAAKPTLALTDLAQEPFILFESGFALNRIIMNACQQNGFEPDVVARSSQISFIIELAAAGLGVAFLPRMIPENQAGPHVAVKRVEGLEDAWKMALLWRRGAYVPHAVRAFVDCIGLPDRIPGP